MLLGDAALAKAVVKKQVKRASPVASDDRWTATKRAAFLAALVDTASVVGAARIADVPERSPYKLRAKDSAFRDAWDAALDEAYDKLELLLLRRATYGENVDGDDAPAISTSFALALLKSHHTKARRGPPRLPRAMRGAELRDTFETQLGEIERRLSHAG